jgi:hypothetical protein
VPACAALLGLLAPGFNALTHLLAGTSAVSAVAPKAAGQTPSPTGTAVESKGARGALTGPDPQLITLTKARRMPGRLSLRCPSVYVLMYAETLTPGEAPLAYSIHGVRVRSHRLPRHRKVAVQITCRAHDAPRLVYQRLGFGTPGPDVIATAAKSGAAFGGPGRDRIAIRFPNGQGNGGLGADKIVAARRDDVATGGPGADRLISTSGERALLIGGPGHDVLIGSRGTTFINAKDGGRDLIVCRSARNRVLLDRADLVRGPCEPVRPR